jgi:exonuclease VII small subunit
MNNPEAALRAAAYAIAANRSYNAAIEELRKVISEIENKQWEG